jgi:hypothetical protein
LLRHLSGSKAVAVRPCAGRSRFPRRGCQSVRGLDTSLAWPNGAPVFPARGSVSFVSTV